MPSREHHGDSLQLRADLWRVPFALCLAAVLLFLITVEEERAATRGTVTRPDWISIGGPEEARAILGAMPGAVSTVLALIFAVARLVPVRPAHPLPLRARRHHPGDDRSLPRVLVMVSFIFLVVFSHRIAMSIQTQNVQ